MDSMLATLERVRLKHQFNGFIHAKIIPGAEEAQIQRAMQLADRVSVNLEPGDTWNHPPKLFENMVPILLGKTHFELNIIGNTCTGGAISAEPQSWVL